MITKIIILTDYPVNRRDYDRFGVERLHKNGFEVEIWDLTIVLHKNFSSHETLPGSLDTRVRLFYDKRQIISKISSLGQDCMMNCFIDFGPATFFLFRALSRRKIPYSVFQMVSFPLPVIPSRGLLSSFSGLIKKITALKISSIYYHIGKMTLLRYYRAFGISPAAIVITAGTKSLEIRNYPVGNDTRFLWAHAFDYDLFLEEKETRVPDDQPTAVFLDEYYPFHPDFSYLGIANPFSPNTYYPKICAFFSYLEKEFGVKIIIAAHPRSNYENLPNYFEGRDVIKGETIRLVKESRFVISHMSTAINFAILYRKPMLFITMDKLQERNVGVFIPGYYIRAIASELHTEPINLDDKQNTSIIQIPDPDITAYSRYQSKYIKKEGTPEIPLWDIYLAEVKKIDNNSKNNS